MKTKILIPIIYSTFISILANYLILKYRIKKYKAESEKRIQQAIIENQKIVDEIESRWKV